MTALLSLHRTTKRFANGLIGRSKGVTAVDDVSFAIDRDSHQITAVVGESGSGKTTLARLLLGIEAPSEGRVEYGGKEIRNLTHDEWDSFRREVQAIFQDPFSVYNPFYRVDHVLKLPLSCFKVTKDKDDVRARIERALELVGLRPDETLRRYPHQLSGGQRQRIMVARALMLDPQVIVADEPVSMLDASLRATILKTLQNLNTRLGISMVYITHDLTTAYQIAHRIIVMFQGSVVEAGDVEKVIKSPSHPYTRELVESVPTPDPKTPWMAENTRQVGDDGERVGIGCKYARRCPHVMPLCATRRPPIYRLDTKHAATCFLYEKYEELDESSFQEVCRP